MEHGDASKASGYFEHAIQAKPDVPVLLEWHAIALATQGRYPEAVVDLERANALQPDSAEVLRMLGSARYDADRTGDAISAWKHALELSPDSNTQYLLRKAERELEVEEKSRSKGTLHFTLHYQGERTASEFHNQILDTLENAYQDLSRQFNYTPGENIIVILYTQQEFEDITEAAGVGVLDATPCALFADVDNDGYQDLLVVRVTGPLLFLNQRNGTFRLKPDAFRFADEPLGTFTCAAFADYDRDGWLDVYFCLYSYYQGLTQNQYPTPYYNAQNGPPNFLFRNNRDNTFTDVTVRTGLDQNNNRYSFDCHWADYDNDGWPDLYVVNDFGKNNLYHNNGDGTFTDVTKKAGVADAGAHPAAFSP